MAISLVGLDGPNKPLLLQAQCTVNYGLYSSILDPLGTFGQVQIGMGKVPDRGGPFLIQSQSLLGPAHVYDSRIMDPPKHALGWFSGSWA